MYKKQLILFLLLIAAAFSQAQDFTIPVTSKVYANMDSCYAHFQVLNHTPELKTRIEKEYYWYLNNRLHHSFGAFEGKLAHSTFTCFYANDNLKEKGNFKKGVKNGKWIKWHANGVISEIYRCDSKGQRKGKVRFYNESGKLSCKAHYKNNKPDGKYKLYTDAGNCQVKRYKAGVEVLPTVKKGNTENKKAGIFRKLFPKPNAAAAAKRKAEKEQQVHLKKQKVENSQKDRADTTTQTNTEKKASFFKRIQLKIKNIHIFKKKDKTAEKPATQELKQ